MTVLRTRHHPAHRQFHHPLLACDTPQLTQALTTVWAAIQTPRSKRIADELRRGQTQAAEIHRSGRAAGVGAIVPDRQHR